VSKPKAKKPAVPVVRPPITFQEVCRVGSTLYVSEDSAKKDPKSTALGIDHMLVAAVGERVYLLAPEPMHLTKAKDIKP